MLLRNVEENLNIKFYGNDVSIFQINLNVQYTFSAKLFSDIILMFTKRIIRYEEQRKYRT